VVGEVAVTALRPGDAKLAVPQNSLAATPIATPKLVAQSLSKSYGPTVALEPTDLQVAAGELMTILGPSGSGKTTLLQIICGLTEPTGGRLFIDGIDQTHTPAHRRHIGVVFQNYALFPHLTVEENVGFPLQMRRMAGAELRGKVTTALEMVGLGTLKARFPRELSGGQQQRVALARCFVYLPSLILMDEPLGALDRKLRESMQIEIKRLHRDTGATILFVTHDQEEALALSDRICLMNEGHVEQVGTPQEIYEQPHNTFVAAFIGLSNALRGRVGPDRDRLVTPDGAFPIPPAMRAHAVATLVVRPEHIELAEHGQGAIIGVVSETVYAGAETRLFVTLASGTVISVRRAAGTSKVGLGETVSLGWSPERARFLAE
jgi:putative spermidine/putrescine transport system ATP-binding protein